jgi:aspartate racemase
MKTLGVLGGIGPESTIAYYRALIAAGRAVAPAGGQPPILINSIDVQRVLHLVEHNALPELVDYLVRELQRLMRGGADLGLIAANTPHIVFDDIRARSPLPLVSIVEAARDAVRAGGFHRVGLFGTRFTMQARFYPDVFSIAGVEIIAPEQDEQAYIHDKYVNELLIGLFSPTTRDGLLAIVDALKVRDGVQAVLLAGTELPLLLTDSTAASVPLLDTTAVHVQAAAWMAWGGSA